nr:hypothetical protein [Tanacetum cinerariifolium]
MVCVIKHIPEPVDMGLPFTPKDGTHQSHSLLEGKTSDPQDLEGNIYPDDTGLPATNPNDDFEDDLKDVSDEEVIEAGDDMETNCPHTTEEHSQPPLSTDKTVEDNWAKHEEAVASYGDLRAKIESIKSDLASLQDDTSDIKAMVTDIFCAFKGQSFSTPSKNVSMARFAITDVNIAIGGGGGRIQHLAYSEKLKKKAELRKNRYDNYIWTITCRKKPERITDIFIHLRIRQVTMKVYKNNDPRNFEVLNELKFSDYGISKWDELSVILPKKYDKCVGEMMTSRSKKYKRLKEISNELGLDLTLPLPKQDPSLLRRKKKEIKLEPETYIFGLDCKRELPEGVKFVKNLVIENPVHGLFFIAHLGMRIFKDSVILTRLRLKLCWDTRSLNEQSFSELPSSVQLEFLKKYSPFSEAILSE